MKTVTFTFLLLGFIRLCQSQTIDLTVEDTVCLGAELNFTNLSSGFDSVQFDFCPGDFEQTPGYSSSYNIPASSDNQDEIETFLDDGIYYSIILGLDNKIGKITIGSDLTGLPASFTDLGNLGTLNSPRRLSGINENGTWRIFITNLVSNTLSRIDFDSGLGEAVSSSTNVGNVLSELSQPYAIDIVNWEDNFYMAVGNHGSKEVKIFDYGNSMLNAPTLINTISCPSTIGNLTSIQTVIFENSIHMVVGGQSNVLVYDLGDGLSNSANLVQDFNQLLSLTSPRDLDVAYDNGEIIVLVVGISGNIWSYRFDEQFNFLSAIDIGQIDGISDTRTLDFNYKDSDWIGFSINRSSQKEFNLIEFTQTCSASIFSSAEVEPSGLSYDSIGLHHFTFQAISSGVRYHLLDSVLVKGTESIFFSDSLSCSGVQTQFSPQVNTVASEIISYSWDFGDPASGSENTSTEISPTHSYEDPGDYTVTISATDECGIMVDSTRNVKIYDINDLTANFVSDPIACINNSIQFEDGSSYTEDSPVAWNWDFDGLGSSSQQDATYSFESTGTYDITLSVTGISGCRKMVTSELEIRDTPAASFTVEDNCLGELTSYENGSASGLNYAWAFGDGFESDLENPSHEYGTAGAYTTTLVVTDDIGCATTVQESLEIFAIPKPGFQYGLICENDSVIFQDTSTVENGDIEAWEWYIDGVLVSNEKDPKLSFSSSGDFTVRQVVTGTGECAVTNERTVNILEAPVPSFDIVSACIGEPFTFLNTTEEGTYLSREFSFGEQVFEADTFQLEFTSPGSYEMTLTLANKNLCSTTLTQSFTVTAPPEFNIQSQNICANESTILQDLSTSDDEIISRTWTVNGEEIGNGTQVNYFFGETGDYDLSLDVITQNGCEYSYSESISILDPPTAAIESSSDYAISGNSIQFLSVSSSDSIFWFFEGDSLRSDSTFSRLFNEEGTFNFSQVVVAENGCLDTTSLDILVAVPDVDLRLMSFEIIDDGSGFGQVIAAVLNESNLPIEDIEFTLTLDNALPLKERFTDRIEIGQSGIFNLNTSIPLSQNFVSTICLQVASRISESDATPYNNENCLTREKKAVIEPPFPNPASGELTINIVLPEEENVSFRMLDMTGKEKLKKSYPEKFSGLTTFLLELQDVPPGLYFLEITAGNRVDVSRIAVK